VIRPPIFQTNDQIYKLRWTTSSYKGFGKFRQVSRNLHLQYLQ